jgi:hypothetical protein
MDGKEDVLTVVTWWRRQDSLPRLPRIAGFGLRCSSDDAEMALLQGSFEGVIAARREAGNVAYVGRLRGEPVAYAWLSEKSAHIGSHGLSFELPPGQALLWELTVLEAGKAVAAGTHLLHSLLERHKVGRIWAVLPCDRVHEAEAAGMSPVAQLYRCDGEARIEAIGDPARAADAARLFGLPGPAQSPERTAASTAA